VDEHDRPPVEGSGLDDMEAEVAGTNETLPETFRERVQRIDRDRRFDGSSLAAAGTVRR